MVGDSPGEQAARMHDLGRHFDELAGLLVSAQSGPPSPDRVVRFAARAVPHTKHTAGVAVGILMARHLVTYDEAFAQLVTASQHLNRKLRDIALEVVDTGELPDEPGHHHAPA